MLNSTKFDVYIHLLKAILNTPFFYLSRKTLHTYLIVRIYMGVVVALKLFLWILSRRCLKVEVQTFFILTCSPCIFHSFVFIMWIYSCSTRQFNNGSLNWRCVIYSDWSRKCCSLKTYCILGCDGSIDYIVVALP